MHGKGKKGRGKEEKKRKGKKKWVSNCKKTKEIRNTIFRIKQTMSTFVFMQDFFDEQITRM